MKCPHCGARNEEARVRCVRCAERLTKEASPSSAATTKTRPPGLRLTDKLIPSTNKYALKSYYYGVFSWIPCMGMPLAMCAIIYGALGLSIAQQNPSLRGKVHATAGLVLGGISLLLQGMAFLWVMNYS